LTLVCCVSKPILVCNNWLCTSLDVEAGLCNPLYKKISSVRGTRAAIQHEKWLQCTADGFSFGTSSRRKIRRMQSSVRPLCVTATINGSKLQVKSSGGRGDLRVVSLPCAVSHSASKGHPFLLVLDRRTPHGKLLVRSPSISGLFQPTTSITLISS
jgi:hypothetical protein